MVPPGELFPPTPAALARHIASQLAPRLAGVPGWSEREVLARVSPRPVGGLTVWRTPVAGALAAATGESPAEWAEAVRGAVLQLPSVERATWHGTAVDVTIRVPSWTDLLPSTRDDRRLWHGPPATLTVRQWLDGGESTSGEPVVDRAGVFVDALRGLSAATGEAFVTTTGGRSAHIRVAGPVTSREIAFGPLIGDLSPLLAAGRPNTPARAALLLAPPEAPVQPAAPALLARTPSNPGFLLIHTALALAGETDCWSYTPVRDDGAESLVIALASYPFVVEKAVTTADPAVVLRHLLDIAGRCARWRAAGVTEAGGMMRLRRSAAMVLAHGIEALGMRLPTRI